ncbi:XRE family transcriptional regulator [Actinokineospora inagensis]|uniref:XRE family transcriptional regulator n=1 Tax=Actinokineospora inagensis TaxID=103730 RepID=UPI0003F544CB|nr:XRE family transcriptional regulator [Actinokineospora inagensis]
MSTELAELLRHHRSTAGLTQAELADRSGVSLRAISDLERAQALRPQQRTIDALADALALGGEPLDRFRRSARTAPPRKATTPRAHGLVGREQELADLIDYLTPGAVAVLYGPAGSGKTALAVHAASKLRDRFPDGVVRLDMAGRDPVVLLGHVLDALGAQVRNRPLDLPGLTALCRRELRDRRLLLVLDHAEDEAQTRPLLLHGPGSAVVVTTRRATSGFAVGPLTEFDAITLLARMIGQDRVTAESAAARHVVNLCGRLPLALRLVGGTMAPQWTLAGTAGQLANEPALVVAYRRLDPTTALVLRRLTLAPVVDVEIAAALTDTVAAEALDRLVSAGFLDSRYRMPSLVREFAAVRLRAEGDAGAVRGSETRLTRLLLSRIADTPRSSESATFARPPGQEWWTRTLHTGIRLGLHTEVLAAVTALHRYTHVPARWTEVFTLAADAARAIDDTAAEAANLNNLGWAIRTLENRSDSAIRLHQKAYRIAEGAEKGWSLLHRGIAEYQSCRTEIALASVESGIGYLAGTSLRLTMAQSVRARLLDVLGRHSEALPVHRDAVDTLRLDLDCDTPTLAGAIVRLGSCLAALRLWPEACATFRESARLFAAADMPLDAAHSRLRMVSALFHLGRTADAEEQLADLRTRPLPFHRALTELHAAGGPDLTP